MSRSLFGSSLALPSLLTLVGSGSAQDPAYLAAWPSIERVLADHQGEDHEDTLARQVAALNQLDRAMEDLADDRRWNDLTADELALRGRLRSAAARLREEANATLASELGPGFHWPWEQAPRAAWYGRQWRYESDPDFRDATLSRYLPPDLLAELEVRKAASDARGQAAGRELLVGLGVRESTWQTMTMEERRAFQNAAAVLMLLLALLLMRELRTFGVRESDPLHLRAGSKKFGLRFHQGLVEGYESNTGGFNEGFWLRGEHGWYQVGVQGAYARIPEGHLATAVDAHGPKERLGYVVFFDHDASAIRPVEGTLRSLFAPRRWLLVPVLGLAFLWGASSNEVPADTPLVRGLLVALLAWVVTAALLRWVERRRLRRFSKRGVNHVLTAAAGSAEALRKRIPRVAPPPPPLTRD